MWPFASGFFPFASCFLMFILVLVCISAWFLFVAEYYSIVSLCNILCIHSSIDGHTGCFCLLTIVNRAALNIRRDYDFYE